MIEQPNDDHNVELSVEETALMMTGGSLGASIRAAAHEAGGERPRVTLPEVLELHVCIGLNACGGHDVDGDKGRIAGTGRCATALHVCHGDNECRGQGGCGYLGDEYEQSIPGEQSCRQNGSCASPINECRVASAGPFKGTGVWKLARKRFEQRMWQAGVIFGQSPQDGYPDDLVPLYETDRVKELLESKHTRVAYYEATEAARPPLPEYQGRG